jgi:hypothetical protein
MTARRQQVAPSEHASGDSAARLRSVRAKCGSRLKADAPRCCRVWAQCGDAATQRGEASVVERKGDHVGGCVLGSMASGSCRRPSTVSHEDVPRLAVSALWRCACAAAFAGRRRAGGGLTENWQDPVSLY